MAKNLMARGYLVSVMNPARIKKFGESQLQRNKTDKLDAALIAEYCRKMQPPQWIPPTAAVRELQALERHLDDLRLMQQQTANRLESTLPTPIILEHLQAQLALLDEQLEQTKRAILAHVNACPELKE